MGLSEGFRVGDEFRGAFCYQMNIDDFPFGNIDVYGGVYVDEVISGEDSGLEGFLYAVHGVFHAPFFCPLLVLEPGTAVVDGDDDGTGEVYAFRFETHGAHKFFLGHPGIAAVTVYLVEGGCEIYRGIVALCSTEGSPDHRRRIGAGCEDGAGNSGLRMKFVDTVKKLFCLFHITYIR